MDYDMDPDMDPDMALKMVHRCMQTLIRMQWEQMELVCLKRTELEYSKK